MAMRLLAAVAVLVSAAVHLYLWFDGFGTPTSSDPPSCSTPSAAR